MGKASPTPPPLHHAPPGEERLAILYSDGGIGILTAGTTLDRARREREFCDANDDDRSHWSRIIRLNIPPWTLVENPADAEAAPEARSEVEELRAEVASLKARLEQGGKP